MKKLPASQHKSVESFFSKTQYRAYYTSIKHDPIKKHAYLKVLNALLNFEDNVSLLIEDEVDVDWAFDLVLIHLPNDIVELFYLDSVTATVCGDTFDLNFTYCMSKSEVLRKLSQLQQRIRDCLEPISSPVSCSSYERLLCVHDWCVSSFTYCDADLKEDHTVIGPMLTGKGVCEGIAKSMKLLLDHVGLPACVVVGKTGVEKDSFHAWTTAFILSPKGRYGWTAIDATYDLWNNESARLKASCILKHQYFGFVESEKTKHTRDQQMSGHLPICTVTLNYYKRNCFYARSLSELPALIEYHAARKDAFVFKLPLVSTVEKDDVDKVIEPIVHRALRSVGFSGKYTQVFDYEHMLYTVYDYK